MVVSQKEYFEKCESENVNKKHNGAKDLRKGAKEIELLKLF